MCQTLGVKRQGYYAYMRRQVEHRPDPDLVEKTELVRKIVTDSGYTYGSRRVKEALNACGYPISRDQARRLMKAAQVAVKQRKKYKVTTNSNHSKPVYANVLDRGFQVEQPNQGYVGDITYI
jgi:putative transposase